MRAGGGMSHGSELRLRSRSGGVLIAAFVLAGACSAPGLNAESTCREYFTFPASERERVVRSLAVEVGARDAGSPFFMFNFDPTCAANPDISIRRVVELFVDE